MRNACGVCARKIASLGKVASTYAPADADPPDRFTVSRDPTAAIAAPDSAAAAIVRSMISPVTSGRAASWTTAISVSSASASTALATESWRRSPPATREIRGRQRYPGGSRSISGGTATITSRTPGQARNASTLHCNIGRPATVSSCLGTLAPRRRPRPPAAMMAVTCMVAWISELLAAGSRQRVTR